MTRPDRSSSVRLGRRTESSADSGRGRSRAYHNTVTATASVTHTEAMNPHRNSQKNTRRFRDRAGGDGGGATGLVRLAIPSGG
jgi:hypothetical protein